MEKIKHEYSARLGQKLIIWISGDVNTYIAEVIKEEPLWLKVEESGPYAKLKPGDYIIKEYYSAQWQSNQDGANKLLQDGLDHGRPFLSGLKSLNVPDGKLHVIGPCYE